MCREGEGRALLVYVKEQRDGQKPAGVRMEAQNNLFPQPLPTAPTEPVPGAVSSGLWKA